VSAQLVRVADTTSIVNAVLARSFAIDLTEKPSSSKLFASVTKLHQNRSSDPSPLRKGAANAANSTDVRVRVEEIVSCRS
jgi:hypothetical protein